MAKALVIDHEKCDGCRKCVSACAIKRTGTDDPVRSRIRIEGWMQEGVVGSAGGCWVCLSMCTFGA